MIKNIKTAAGEIVALRFDLGTSRILKSITKIDPLSEEAPNFEEQAANIFLAAYKRAYTVFKTPQTLTDEEARELFYELELTEAIEIVKAFTEVMSVKADPTKPVDVTVEGDDEKKS